jgi:hypothetical protein
VIKKAPPQRSLWSLIFGEPNSNSTSTSNANPEEREIKAILDQQTHLLQQALTERSTAKAQLAPQKRPPARRGRRLAPGLVNWAGQAALSQSSTERPASTALLTSGSATNTELHPWFRLVFPQPLQFSSISFNQIFPIDLEIQLYNGYGSLVGSQRSSSQTVLWNVVAIVKSIYIRGTSNQPQALGISNLIVTGEAALDCAQYQAQQATIKEQLGRLLTGNVDTPAADLTRQQARLSKLIASCTKLEPSASAAQASVIAQQAQEYDALMAPVYAQRFKAAQQAQAQLAKIQAQQAKEQTVAADAAKYGLPPPPPLYTPAQIAQAQAQVAAAQPVQLTPADKAMCFTLNQQMTTLQTKATTLGRLASNNPSLLPQVKTTSDEYERLQAQYHLKCDPNGPTDEEPLTA